MGILLCEQHFRDFGDEIKAYGQKLVKFCTHTHTHAATLVVEIVAHFKMESQVASIQTTFNWFHDDQRS